MLKNKIHTILGITAALGLTAGAGAIFSTHSTSTPAQSALTLVGYDSTHRDEARAPNVIVLAFHADWCAGCKVLGPKLMNDVLPALKDKPYLFVKLDQTDRNSKQAEYMVASLGLGKLWSEHGGKTGYALVIDAQTKQVVDTLRYTQEPTAMVSSVQNAISR